MTTHAAVETAVETPAETTVTKTYRVIGTRPIRHDGMEKVTGKALFGADMRLPGMLYGAVLRSPHPHARIVSIDTSRALAHPEVRAVITGADFPDITRDEIADLGEGAIGLRYAAQLIMARDKVVFKGQPVAAVAATSRRHALEALALIDVVYEPLPVVEDAVEAMSPDAPLIHDDLYTEVPGGERSDKPSNVALHVQHERGDVARGFAEADVIVEREFRTQMVHQGYIEPQAALAVWEPDGRATVWCSTQGAFTVRKQLADQLQIPIGRITVIPTEIGGGFGGKIQVYLEPLALLLSRKSGRPVKMWMSRSEVFQATGPGAPAYIRLKMGAKRTGEITAAEHYLVYDAGGFPGSPVKSACVVGLSPYRIPNFKIDGFDVVTNKPRVQSYRAPGGTAAAFSVETVVDELAERIGMDPVEFRLKNAARSSDRMTNDLSLERIGFVEVLEAALNHPHYRAPLPEGQGRVGRGVAAGFWANGRGTSSVQLTFNPDGTVNLVEGSTDIGGSRVALAMIVAEELGLKPEDVKPMVVGTDSIGHTDTTGGSRVTYSTGTACWLAARDAIAQLKGRAALLLGVDADDVEFRDGVFYGNSGEGRSIGIRDVIARLGETGGAIVARGVSHGLKLAPGFGAHIVDVRVDEETGKVDVLRYTAIQDAGKAIHPTYVEGQMQGGVAQGIGWALTEEYVFKDGVLQNPTLLDYRIPTAMDLPMIDTHIVEVPAADGPYGVRGVGEVPIVPPPAAVANAIYRAVGVRMQRLPMSPERVWRALQQAAAEEA